MSVAEVFLRGGTPCTQLGALPELLSNGYDSWCWVVSLPRFWCRDQQVNEWLAPALHGLFGLHSRSKEWHLLYITASKCARDAAFSAATWTAAISEVLTETPRSLHPRDDMSVVVLSEGSTHERLCLFTQDHLDCFGRSVERGVRDRFCFAKAKMGGESVEKHQRRFWSPVLFRDGDSGSSTVLNSSAHAAEAVALMQHAMHWVVDQYSHEEAKRALPFSLVDASYPRVLTTGSAAASDDDALSASAALLALLPQLNPLLYSSLFVERNSVEQFRVRQQDEQAQDSEEKAVGKLARLKAECDAGREEWKKKSGEHAIFTVPDSANSQPAIPDGASAAANTGSSDAKAAVTTQQPQPPLQDRPFQHVLLLQKLIAEKRRPLDIDNIDVGPLSPQPIGAELHLFQDRGEALYLYAQLSDSKNLDFCFEDYLHEDGDLLVQLCPIEGACFVDIDALIGAFPDASVFLPKQVKESEYHAQVLCEGSCSAYVFPRVIRRVPTGKVAKLNPLAKSRATVTEESPSADMLAAATRALAFLSSSVVDLHDEFDWYTAEVAEKLASQEAAATLAAGLSTTKTPTTPAGAKTLVQRGYTLQQGVAPVMSLQPGSRRCAWCERQREKMLRCGACKAVSYCCKKHQALDWKEGSHKSECALWRKAQENYVSAVEPAMMAAAEDSSAMGQKRICLRAHDSFGWSCAMSVIDFVKHVLSSTSVAKISKIVDGVLYVHLIGLPADCLSDLLATLSAHATDMQLALTAYSSQSEGMRLSQLRLLLFSDTFSEAQRNEVWGVSRAGIGGTSDAVLLPSTGVLGDIWHARGSGEDATAAAVALLRLCNVKYHEHDHDSQLAGSKPSGGVVSFGPQSGTGLTFLTAALSTMADAGIMGVVPVRFIESSYIGAVRTSSSVMARLESSDKCGVKTKQALLKRSETVGQVVFNAGSFAVPSGWCPGWESSQVCLNGFYCDVEPVV